MECPAGPKFLGTPSAQDAANLPAIKLPANHLPAAPTVFDGPVRPTNGQPDHKVPYWPPRLAWSTLTPGPMVLETETFFR